MAQVTPDDPRGLGKLVALEGNIDTITTQLRLLPHSHMISIIEPFDQYLNLDHEREPFEARKFVRDVHTAATRRNEEARSFLRASAQSRLVFLNGGSISARAICVAEISRRLTYGNFAEAESIFREVVKNGVAGLFKDTNSLESTPVPQQTKATGKPHTNLPKRLDLRSTKNATLLGVRHQREQEAANKENGTPRTQSVRRSRDDRCLEITHTPGESWNVTPESSGWECQQSDDIVTTVLSMPLESKSSVQPRGTDNRSRPISQYSGTFGPQPPSTSRSSFAAPKSIYSTQQTTDIDEDDDYFEYTQDDGNLFSAPQVVYGEARVVDMLSASPTTTTSMRSTESAGYLSLDDDTKDPRNFKQSASAEDFRDSFKILRRSSNRDSTFEQSPKTAFVKASKTTIRRPSNPKTPISANSLRSGDASRTFKGYDIEAEDDFDSAEPVFDITEDVIIHFTDNSPREIFRSISEYRLGSFPILPTPPVTAPIADGYLNQGRSIIPWVYQQCVEDDPFHTNYSPVCGETKRESVTKRINIATNRPKLAPLSTTFPIHRSPTAKLCDFAGAYTNKSIDIQNEFRSFLNFRFPEEAILLNRYQNSLVPDSGAFWKDMFSRASPGLNEGPEVDQIIAVGCEDSISDVFCSKILKQVENIGVRNDGESRSSRLDLRFLIAAAMQTFMFQPPLARKDLDPLTNPKLLADLIAPHLERYLSTNRLVRLLVLSFPINQIATVIALRGLLGSDLVKVAGVLDTLASDPPSLYKPNLPQLHTSHHSYDAALATSIPKRSQRYPPTSSLDASQIMCTEPLNKRPQSLFSLFLKSNYLLPSTASPLEIQSFLSLIRKHIVERSPWYNIEQESPSLKSLMRDASTFTDDLLPMDSNTEVPNFAIEQDSFRSKSPFYDSEESEIEILRSPKGLSTRPLAIRAIESSMSPPPGLLSSSSCSLSDSTIRHIPIAIDRQSIPRDLNIMSKDLFSHDQKKKEEPEYTYEHIVSSTTATYIDRAHSDISTGSLALGLELELEAEEDSEDDAYDRMVMGRYSPMLSNRSMFPNTRLGTGREDLQSRAIWGNSRKALKWLGLA